MPLPSGLTEKHYRLLELVKMNKYTDQELAEKTGFTTLWVNNLLVGSPAAGEIGKLFQLELKKVDKEIEARISRKTNEIRERLITRLTQWEGTIKGGDDVDTKTRHKMLVDGINAVNKSMPYQVNIENYTWKDGMTAEEAVNEYKRIKGLAKQYAIRGRVSELAARGATEGAVPDGLSDEAPADDQDIVLHSEPEAAKLPRIEGEGAGDIRGKQIG